MQKNVEKFGTSDKRGRVSTSLNPFFSDKGLQEPALCKSCRIFYHHKRWVHDPETYQQLKSDPKVHWVTCPACKKIAEGYQIMQHMFFPQKYGLVPTITYGNPLTPAELVSDETPEILQSIVQRAKLLLDNHISH